MIQRVLSATCLLMVAALAGCSSSRGGAVTFTSPETGNQLTQKFSHAYIAPVGEGEYEVLLVDSAADWDYKLPKSKRNRPIDPIGLAPVRQAMRIHMFWRPLQMTTKNPAAINASINWYVMGEDGSNDMLIYEGAAYLTIDGSGDKRTIRIRDGELQPARVRGQLQDPVGHAFITGKANAMVNTARVNDTLAELRQHAENGTK